MPAKRKPAKKTAPKRKPAPPRAKTRKAPAAARPKTRKTPPPPPRKAAPPRSPAARPDPARIQLDRLVAALLDKKGLAVTSIYVGPMVAYTDYFLVVTGTSARHNQTLSDAVSESERKAGRDKPRTEGYGTGLWIVADAGDVVVHIFDDASRHYYDLERLFPDAERRLYGEDGRVVDLPRAGRPAR